MNNKILNTERLILREPKVEDAIAIFNGWTNDKNVNKYVSWKTHESIVDTKDYIDYAIKDNENGGYHWIDELIGDIAIIELKKNHSICEVGYCYGSKYWGKGYATEALRKVLEYMFNVV